MIATQTQPATGPQVAFLRKLANERAFSDSDRARLLKRLNQHETGRVVMSKELARKSIDWLLDRPSVEGRQASDAQVKYIRNLLDERVLEVSVAANLKLKVDAHTTGRKPLQVDEAGRIITNLLEHPVRATEPLEPGVYEYEGVLYLVKKHRNAKRAKVERVSLLKDESGDRLNLDGERVRHELFPAPGMLRRLRREHRVTLATLEKYSLMLNICLHCGRELRVAESVAAGVGPICRQKYS